MSKQLKLQDNGPYSPEIIKCPDCGENYLHHVAVDFYARGEDDKTGVHTRAIDTGLTMVDGEMSGNPSDRRGGMVIKFECEHCPGFKPLHIFQHKGITFVEWGGTE